MNAPFATMLNEPVARMAGSYRGGLLRLIRTCRPSYEDAACFAQRSQLTQPEWPST